MREPIISVRELERTYGRGEAACRALRGLSFDIDAGEWVSIVGPSGSGKTTLLNVLGVLDTSYRGSVRISGQELRKLRDKAASRLRGDAIGFVFQHFNLLPHLTVLENVCIPKLFGGSGSGEGETEHAMRLLKRVGLEDKVGAFPTQLSGGQQQRVSIARALFNEAKLLLCDEPTGALDYDTGLNVMSLFRTLNEKEGITLVVVTHEAYISDMARRIIRLQDGLVVFDGSPESDTGFSKPPGHSGSARRTNGSSGEDAHERGRQRREHAVGESGDANLASASDPFDPPDPPDPDDPDGRSELVTEGNP